MLKEMAGKVSNHCLRLCLHARHPLQALKRKHLQSLLRMDLRRRRSKTVLRHHPQRWEHHFLKERRPTRRSPWRYTLSASMLMASLPSQMRFRLEVCAHECVRTVHA